MLALAIRDSKQSILVIDEKTDDLMWLSNLLNQHFSFKLSTSAQHGLKTAKNNLPDLILLAIVMPEMNGYDVCRELKRHPSTRDIPVLLLSENDAHIDHQTGFDAGAVDFIFKPFSAPIVLARIRTHLLLGALLSQLQNQEECLEFGPFVWVPGSASQVDSSSGVEPDPMIATMMAMLETRDDETKNHLLRTQQYVKILAECLQKSSRFSHLLSDDDIEILFKSAPFHDIGEVGIPDHILLKPGKLTEDEMVVMKSHTTLGRQMIESADKRLGRSIPFLTCVKEIAYSHQEKWDGSGYPEGLVGTQIPLSARLMAVADVYDALIRQQVYKSAMTHEVAVQIMSEGRNTHFDPDVLDAFLQVQYKFRECALRYERSDNEK